MDSSSLDADFDSLDVLVPMRWMSGTIMRSIAHVFNDSRHTSRSDLWRVSLRDAAELRRFLNASLHDYPYAFFLQRLDWARTCAAERGKASHQRQAIQNPARHPCRMRQDAGFRRIAQQGKEPIASAIGYSFEDFYKETIHIFQSLQSHLTAVHTLLGLLYANVATMQFSGFTPAGLNEMRQVHSQLQSVVNGLVFATHLQPTNRRQLDVYTSLQSYDGAAARLMEATLKYAQSHSERQADTPNWPTERPDGEPGHLPTTCLPTSTGVIHEYFALARELAAHARAIFVSSLRLYSTWYPNRMNQSEPGHVQDTREHGAHG